MLVLGASISIWRIQNVRSICLPKGFMATSFRKSFNASCCCSICLGEPFAYPSRIRGDIGIGLKPCFRARNSGVNSFTCCSRSVWP